MTEIQKRIASITKLSDLNAFVLKTRRMGGATEADRNAWRERSAVLKSAEDKKGKRDVE